MKPVIMVEGGCEPSWGSDGLVTDSFVAHGALAFSTTKYRTSRQCGTSLSGTDE